VLRLTEGRSRPSAAMTSAGSTIRGMATELQVISHDDLCWNRSTSLSFGFHKSQVSGYFYKQTPEISLLSPSPTGTRKAAKPPLVCGFVATKRPNRVGERAGNAQGAEPRQDLKRGAGGARRRPITEQRSRGCVPLGWGAHTHQAALNNSKLKQTPAAPEAAANGEKEKGGGPNEHAPQGIGIGIAGLGRARRLNWSEAFSRA
jgi:hypothetical protein